MDNKTIQRWLKNVTLDQIYFNLTFTNVDNLTIYVLQGNTLKSAKRVLDNPKVNVLYRYHANLGMTLYVIAYPTNTNSLTMNGI